MQVIILLSCCAVITFASALPAVLEDENNKENLTVAPRIAGGQPMYKTHYYEVAILSTDTLPIKLCSGALLNSKWVLTSAYCAKRRPVLRVQFGSNTILTQGGGGLLVYKAHCHPYYNPLYMSHDIALLELNPVATGEYLTQVVLPPNAVQNYLGQTAVVSGWGPDGSTSPASYWLSYKDTTIVDNAYCQRQGHVMSPYKLCTEDRTICEGDQGAPLVIGGQIIGIATAASEASNCDGAVVTAYTRINYYLGWITQVTKFGCTTC